MPQSDSCWAGAVALLLVGCGDTGPTQAQEQADGYVSAYKIQFDKVSKLRDTTGTDCADSKPTSADDLGNLALAAKAAAAALPKAPGCMAGAGTKAQAGFTQIRDSALDAITAAANQSDADAKAAGVGVNAGADQLVAAATDIGKAKS
jgi:hypothetical protein